MLRVKNRTNRNVDLEFDLAEIWNLDLAGIWNPDLAERLFLILILILYLSTPFVKHGRERIVTVSRRS